MMNIEQTRKAQNAIRNAIAICEAKGGIDKAVETVNKAWIDAGECYPLPVGEYRRYSWVMADLTRIQVQLADQLRDLEFGAGLPVDEETGVDLREWSGNSIAADHADALEVNKVVDFAVKVACCHADLDSVTHNAINNAIDHVRHDLLEMNRFNNRFIVKMMASVSRQAKTARAAAKVRHQQMLERCAKATNEQILSEIPF